MIGLELYIYVDNVVHGIDLFKDEMVSLSSSIQNANDISKTFTDYTQTFTIPASNNNNAIFKHWYENSYLNGFDHRIRYNAYIELDTIPFRSGKIQLEKANIKNGVIDSYSITFYGNLVQLKDRFGEDKLNNLDYSSIGHTYSAVDVLTRIKSNTSYDVRYPLIGANTRYEYKTGAALYDVTISSTQSCIRYDSLFPAVRVSKIMEFIENKYDIDFTGDFLINPLYTNLFLYAKNAEILKPFGAETRINFGTSSMPSSGNTSFNLSTDVLSTETNTYITTGSGLYDFIVIDLRIFSTSNVYYNVYVYKNGVLFQTYLDKINNSNTISLGFYQGPNANPVDTYYVTVSASGALNYTAEIRWDFFTWTYQPSTYEWTELSDVQYITSTTVNQTSSGLIDVKNYVPDMKVVDFLTGIIKAFNLILEPQDERTFKLIPLETYYTSGIYRDITPYVITDDITLDRPKLYKKISFSYEQSNNILNNRFDTTTAQIRGYRYGDLEVNNINSNESQTYEIKLPFENVMWERAGVGTQSYKFQSATMWDKDLKPYIPKPILIYQNGIEDLGTGSTNTLKISQNTSATSITQSSTYMRFSNEYNLLGNTSSDVTQAYSLNWGSEISSWYLTNVDNSLYQVNYNNYINNLYDIKTRLVKVKAKMPITTITDIKLNDRIIIQDKRYLINTMNTNLTTGVVDFDLIVDNRTV